MTEAPEPNNLTPAINLDVLGKFNSLQMLLRKKLKSYDRRLPTARVQKRMLKVARAVVYDTFKDKGYDPVRDQILALILDKINETFEKKRAALVEVDQKKKNEQPADESK